MSDPPYERRPPDALRRAREQAQLKLALQSAAGLVLLVLAVFVVLRMTSGSTEPEDVAGPPRPERAQPAPPASPYQTLERDIGRLEAEVRAGRLDRADHRLAMIGEDHGERLSERDDVARGLAARLEMVRLKLEAKQRLAAGMGPEPGPGDPGSDPPDPQPRDRDRAAQVERLLDRVKVGMKRDLQPAATLLGEARAALAELPSATRAPLAARIARLSAALERASAELAEAYEELDRRLTAAETALRTGGLPKADDLAVARGLVDGLKKPPHDGSRTAKRNQLTRRFTEVLNQQRLAQRRLLEDWRQTLRRKIAHSQQLLASHRDAELRAELAGIRSLVQRLEGIADLPHHVARDLRSHKDSYERMTRTLSSRTQPVSPAAIDLAINRAQQGLVRGQLAGGNWGGRYQKRFGQTALILLALLESGLPPTHPTIVKGLAQLRGQQPGENYDAALGCMMLGALSRARAPKRTRPARPRASRRSYLASAETRWLRELVGKIVSSSQAGGWSYLLTGAAGSTSTVRPPGGGAGGAGRGPGGRRPPGGGPPPPRAGAGHPRTNPDLSNTQYAILGLRAAELAGIKVGNARWTAILKTVLDLQLEDGAGGGVEISGKTTPRGWAYRPRQAATFTMTCAGLAIVVIAAEQLHHHRALTGVQRARVKKAVTDGVAWLASRYGDNVAGRGAVNGYLLYGLERVGILSERPIIGGNWYRDGAKRYVEEQQSDGSWRGPYGPDVETAFGLLFLKKATQPTAIEITRSSGG